MKRSFIFSRIGVPLVLAAVSGGCTPSNSVPAGAPILRSFSVVDPSGAPVELETEAGPVTVPPLSHFVATFDRLLDPTPVSMLVPPDGGAPTPKAGVALIDWTGGAVESTTLYTPNGHHMFALVFPTGPSLSTTPTAGLPSGTAVTVTLDPAKVRSHDQKTAYKADDGVNATLSFTTDPLMVTITVPAPDPGDADAGVPPMGPPPVDPDFVAPVTFNNVTTAETAGAIQVAATVGGAPVASLGEVVAQDAASGANWTVSPPAAGWPAGAVVTITVGAAAADTFGMTLDMAATASFTVKP